MEYFTPEQVESAIERLPTEISGEIFDESTSSKIMAIGKANGLHLDQIDSLVTTTRLAMIGVLSETAFSQELVATGVSSELIPSLEKELHEKVIGHVLNQLKENGDDNEESGTGITESKTAEGLSLSGIEIMPRQETEQIMPQIDRETLLAGVENPKSTVKTFSPDTIAQEVHRGIAGEKLSGGFTIPKESRDYSIGKSQTPPPADDPILRHRDRTDPYREPI